MLFLVTSESVGLAKVRLFPQSTLGTKLPMEFGRNVIL